MGYKGRDVEVIPVENELCLIIACDSCGAIGAKELDRLKVPPEVVGRYTVRVALMEVIAAGGTPAAVTAAISNEYDPTGEKVVQGIKEELTEWVSLQLPIAISTEKNMATLQTGVGITVIGKGKERELRLGRSAAGDLVYCLGLPKVGKEVLDFHGQDIVQPEHIKLLQRYTVIHDILPVGSQGIYREACKLAAAVDSDFSLHEHIRVDVEKSGGPSTCLLFTCPPAVPLPEFGGIYIEKVGRLISRERTTF